MDAKAQDQSDILLLTGPTASGKTELGVRIAQACAAEIIAADSMTLYRGMDVGTAKPSSEQRALVPHHLIDVLDPWENASVAWWLSQARAAVSETRARGRRVLFVGGTALYLKALLFGLFDGPGADLALRQRLEAEALSDPEALSRRLLEVDPAAGQRLHSHDRRRIIRALEVWELTGRPMSDWQEQWRHARSLPVDQLPATFWLDIPRQELHRRIDARVVEMMSRGWLDEARALRALPRALSNAASQAVGYRELFDHLEGRLSLPEATLLTQTRTRQFAKRQVTWFRHLPGCNPVTQELTFSPWNLRIHI